MKIKKNREGERLLKKLFRVLRTEEYVSKLKGPIKFSALHENRFSPSHIMVKFQNSGNWKEMTLSVQRGKAGHSQMIRKEDNFRSENGSKASKILRKSYLQPKILYSAPNPVKCIPGNRHYLTWKSKILTLWTWKVQRMRGSQHQKRNVWGIGHRKCNTKETGKKSYSWK